VSIPALAALALGLCGAALLPAQDASGMLNTKHNLAATGPGPIQALTETRVCIFCHTPHNAAPDSPLWNRELEPQFYTVYASPTLQAGVLPQPWGPTKLCLSCHDGTVAMGAVLNPAGGIAMGGSDDLPPGSLSDFGFDLSGHHPVSFSYSASLPNPELEPAPPDDLTFGGVDEMHCSTCHDPHQEGFGKFLVKDHRASALCVSCHKLTGWESSLHATSTAEVGAWLPRPPKTWPNWTSLGDWGCEACHTPHFAPTAEQLLNFGDAPPEPFACTSCHGAEPPGPPHLPDPPGAAGFQARTGRTDIALQVNKISAHPEATSLRARLPRGSGTGSRATFAGGGTGGWRGCGECHNAHQVNDQTADLPYVSGLLAGVPGVDRNGTEVDPATYEYEICLRCHGDDTPDPEFVPRVVASTNTRLDFDPGNPSFHPVIERGRVADVPSLPSSLSPRMLPSEQIGCTSCHADDEGSSRGPHGSSFPPILKERYEVVDGTSESYESYALCYRCHERTSILADESFRTRTFRTTPSGGGHSGHLAAGITCSACHDPHGIDATGSSNLSGTGDHTHLINFDSRIVAPLAGAPYPVFTDTGASSGSCTLACHGFTHTATSYP
jgi:predicted CXXCH cytochrome family protein